VASLPFCNPSGPFAISKNLYRLKGSVERFCAMQNVPNFDIFRHVFKILSTTSDLTR